MVLAVQEMGCVKSCEQRLRLQRSTREASSSGLVGSPKSCKPSTGEFEKLLESRNGGRDPFDDCELGS